MALTLTLRQGGYMMVGPEDGVMEKVTLADIVSDYQAVLEVGGSTYTITDDQMVEVLPDVMVSLGPPNTLPGNAKIVIDAPRRINIVRDSVVGKKRKHA